MIKTLLAIALCVVGCAQTGLAQVQPVTILTIDVENVVQYFEDTSDVSKFATDPSITTPALPKNLNGGLVIGDVVAVNGQRVKGTMTRNARSIFLTPTPTPGLAIADTVRNATTAFTFEILASDMTPIGTIIAYGFSGGPASPGLPLSATTSSFAIVGGTGAFVGIRGQMGKVAIPQAAPERAASMTEDPSNRRRNGGGPNRWALQVIPMEAPQVVTYAGFPSVIHSTDSSLVTGSNPAMPGEVLSLFANGLGPTTPGVNPGQPFPASPSAVVSSPVTVTVNGQSAEILSAVGSRGQWTVTK